MSYYEYVKVDVTNRHNNPAMKRVNKLAKEGWRVVAAGGGGDVAETFAIMEREIS